MLVAMLDHLEARLDATERARLLDKMWSHHNYFLWYPCSAARR